MYDKALRPAWVEIDLKNLDYNIKNIQKKIGKNTELIGVIKADAYGHGSIKVAEILKNNHVKTFAVASLTEAITLRDNGFTEEEIIILGITPPLYADTIVQYNLTPVICTLDSAAAISASAQASGKTIWGLLKIDTGMGRIGYRLEDPSAIPEIRKISSYDGLKIKGTISHFATSDSIDKSYAHIQEEQYNKFYKELAEAGIDIPKRTFANSAAIMELPDSHYDAVRAGIVLYGCYPSDEVDKSQLELKPVMSVKATITYLKEIPEGASVSYGREYIAKRKSKIATLTLGYADGYPRPYSSVGKVIVNGQFAPIAGNICMDQCMIDVTDIPDVEVGDQVIIMGSDGTNTILADDIAAATGTINYEIICAFGQRLPKIYL